jgi:cation transport regulator ChaC
MARRCPNATVVGGTKIKGFDLQFRSGLATVEPSENGATPVLAWEIDARDEQALDHYEGYPSLYRKELHPVELDGQTVEAMVYIMNDGHPYQEPGSHYYNTIREGYESSGFDVYYLDDAVERSIELSLEQDSAPSFGQQLSP